MNKKPAEQKSIEQKVDWASGQLNKYLIEQLPTEQMHLNKITATIEQILNWTSGHIFNLIAQAPPGGMRSGAERHEAKLVA